MDSKSQDPYSSFTGIPITKGSQIASESSNYIVEDILGKGGFGVVVKCLKSANNKNVALKIAQPEHRLIEKELEQEQEFIMRKLNNCNPDGYFIGFETSFIYEQHLCQEFELLDISLGEFLDRRKRLNLQEIRKILSQAGSALQLLKNLGIIHGDLKPENIMMVNHIQQPLRIKIIDFGFAVHTTRVSQCSILQTMFYRAPEIFLGCPFDEGIDMWSLGCIAAELFFGCPMFQGSNDYEMLWSMTRLHGGFLSSYVETGLRYRKFYSLISGKMWTLLTPEQYGNDPIDEDKVKILDDVKKLFHDLFSYTKTRCDEAEKRDFYHFSALLKNMLWVDPKYRIKPSALVNESFLTMNHLKTSLFSHYAKDSFHIMNIAFPTTEKRSRTNKSEFISPRTEFQPRSPLSSNMHLAKKQLYVDKEKIDVLPSTSKNVSQDYTSIEDAVLTGSQNKRQKRPCSPGLSGFSPPMKRLRMDTEKGDKEVHNHAKENHHTSFQHRLQEKAGSLTVPDLSQRKRSTERAVTPNNPENATSSMDEEEESNPLLRVSSQTISTIRPCSPSTVQVSSMIMDTGTGERDLKMDASTQTENTDWMVVSRTFHDVSRDEERL